MYRRENESNIDNRLMPIEMLSCRRAENIRGYCRTRDTFIPIHRWNFDVKARLGCTRSFDRLTVLFLVALRVNDSGTVNTNVCETSHGAADKSVIA